MIDIELKFDCEYIIPICSTSDVETVESEHSHQSFTFYANEVVWIGEYSAIWVKEESDELGIKQNINRYHFWRQVIDRLSIKQVEYYFHFDENLWTLKIFLIGMDNIIVSFKSKKKVEIMYKIVSKYAGFNNC